MLDDEFSALRSVDYAIFVYIVIIRNIVAAMPLECT